MAARIKRLLNETTGKVFLGVVFVVFLVDSVRGGAFSPLGNDLSIYIEGAAVFFSGNNPYGVDLFRPLGLLNYPLFSCFIVWPFSFLPAWLAHATWFVLNFALLVWVMRAVHTRVFALRFYWVVFAIMLVPMLEPLQSNMRNGQINIVALAGAMGFMVFMKERRDTAAAACLALSASVKMLPVLLFGYLLLNRRWGVFAKGVAWLLVFNIVLPYLVAGSDIIEYYRVYLEVLQRNSAGVYNLGISQASQAAMNLFFNAWLLATLAFMAVVHLRVAKRTGAEPIRVFYLYFMMMLSAVPGVLQPHHTIWLFPPVLALVHDLYFRVESTHYERRRMVVALAVFFVLYNIARYMPMRPFFYVVSMAVLFAMTYLWALDEEATKKPDELPPGVCAK